MAFFCCLVDLIYYNMIDVMLLEPHLALMWVVSFPDMQAPTLTTSRNLHKEDAHKLLEHDCWLKDIKRKSDREVYKISNLGTIFTDYS